MAGKRTLDSDRGYLGNANLKRTNVTVPWTPELIEEYVKCSQDPVYFCQKYVKIIHVDRGLVEFDPYPYQRSIIKSMAVNRYTIIATARQAGKTTSVVGFILWYVIFHPDKTVALLANKGSTAREILGRIQLAYEHLPNWLQQGVVEWNKGAFVLENQSRVIAGATSSSAIRGYSINLLFIDEAAFIEGWDEFFTSVFPTISSGQSTKIVLVSTPNGLNHFYRMWTEANDKRDTAGCGKNGYYPIKVTWQDVPGRDETWRQQTLAAMSGDIDKFNQEHCVEFLGSSGTLITGAVLKNMAIVTPPVQNNEGLKQYDPPTPGHTYALVADVSRGKGLDYSAFSVLDVTAMPYKQVCVFRNNTMTPADYAGVAYRIAKAYNDAMVLVEVNDIGEQVGDIIYNDFEYDNLLFTENAGRGGKRISSGFGRAGDRGIRTSKTVKSVGCSMLKLLIENQQLIINDFETIRELSTFSKKGNSYEAEPGNHDDLVMGLVLFSWLSEQQYFKDLTNINTLQELKQRSEDEADAMMLPFGFVNDGSSHEDLQADGWELTSLDVPDKDFFW